jgi:lipid-binding SYLF domain-containing protein
LIVTRADPQHQQLQQLEEEMILYERVREQMDNVTYRLSTALNTALQTAPQQGAGWEIMDRAKALLNIEKIVKHAR